MSERSTRPALLAAVPSSFEAGLLVEALQQRGIQAWFNSEPSVFYKVLPPFEVAVFVPVEQLERARAAMGEIRSEVASIDWSQVDVGQPADAPPPRLEPQPEPVQPEPPPELVARGREIFLMLLGAELAFVVAGLLYFRALTQVGLTGLLLWGLLWYGCWQGSGCAITLLVLIALVAGFAGCLPPYTVRGFPLLPGAVINLVTAIALIRSKSLQAFFAAQRRRRAPPSPSED